MIDEELKALAEQLQKLLDRYMAALKKGAVPEPETERAFQELGVSEEYFLPENKWRCDECRLLITGEDFFSVEHDTGCSGYLR